MISLRSNGGLALVLQGPLLLGVYGCAAAPPQASSRHFEHLLIDGRSPPATIDLLYIGSASVRRPVVLMLGSIKPSEPPDWSVGLLERGFALVALAVAHPPDPDPARRPQWLVFDERFAHSYALAASRAASDAGRVIDYLATRSDLDVDRIGWLGSSSTGIPGLAAAAQEKRIRAVVAFVSTGALEEWFRTWKENGLWRGSSQDIWPETRHLLEADDPVRHASGLWPAAVLMVNGGGDKVVDFRSARKFFEAALPAYANDPTLLRLVAYEGMGHNLPQDVVRMYAEAWFDLHLGARTGLPPAAAQPPSLEDSVRRTQINAADHREVIGAHK